MARYTCVYCDITGSIASLDSADLRGATQTLVNFAIRLLRVDAADVLIYDAASRRLVYVSGRGFRGKGMEKGTFRANETPAGKVAVDNEMVRISNVSRAANGFASLSRLAGEDFVGYIAAPLTVKDQVKGVLELWSRGNLNPDEEWYDVVHQVVDKGAIALANVLQVRRIQRSNNGLSQAFDAMIEAWSNTLELRNYEPKDHNARVTDLAVDFARLLGLDESEIADLRRGAQLHDIGMIGIPDSILLKPEPLTEEELTVVRRHPMIAYDQLSSVEMLKASLDVPRYHHEKWDGTGYPYGLKGEEIPLTARIFSIVETWEALRSDRPFRKGWPEDRVKQHIAERSGKQFDPDLAGRFLKLLEGGKRKELIAQRQTRHDYDIDSFSV